MVVVIGKSGWARGWGGAGLVSDALPSYEVLSQRNVTLFKG